MLIAEKADKPAPAVSRREAVFLLLQLFSNRDLQRNLNFGTAAEQVPELLCRRWIDEVYVLGAHYFDAPKGDADPELAGEFSREFTPMELEHLARFHRFLELRIGLLTKEAVPWNLVSRHAVWEHIGRDAKNTLGLLGGRGEEAAGDAEAKIKAIIAGG